MTARRLTGVPAELLMTVLLMVLAAAPIAAHVQEGTAAGFLTGLDHPVSGLDHVVAMISVGLWGAQLGAPAVWVLPVAFPMMMAVGGFLGLVGMPLPLGDVGIALSCILLGAVVFKEARPPLAAAATLVAFFAIFHGHAHGAEMPEGQSGLTYSIGFVIATGTLHGVGIGVGLMHRWRMGRTVLRAAGAVVGLTGVAFMASPDDLLSVIAMALLAGLNGPAAGRRALFALPVAWLAGGLTGCAAGSPLATGSSTAGPGNSRDSAASGRGAAAIARRQTARLASTLPLRVRLIIVTLAGCPNMDTSACAESHLGL